MTEEQVKRQDRENDPTVGKEGVEETVKRYEEGSQSTETKPLDPQTERELGDVERAVEDTIAVYDDWG